MQIDDKFTHIFGRNINKLINCLDIANQTKVSDQHFWDEVRVRSTFPFKNQRVANILSML